MDKKSFNLLNLNIVKNIEQGVEKNSLVDRSLKEKKMKGQ